MHKSVFLYKYFLYILISSYKNYKKNILKNKFKHGKLYSSPTVSETL